MTSSEEIDYAQAFEELKVAKHFYDILEKPGLSRKDKLWYQERMLKHYSRVLRIMDGKEG